MQLYSITENGAMRKATKMEFVQNRVYVVDDIKVVYVWFGLKASTKKKDFGIKKAKLLSKKHKPASDIQILSQKKEYGAFLAIMDILKQGITSSADLRRPELEIEIEDLVAAYSPTPTRAILEFSAESYWFFERIAYDYILPQHAFTRSPESWDDWNPFFNASESGVTCGPFIMDDYDLGGFYELRNRFYVPEITTNSPLPPKWR